jgi:alpha-galactosidase
MDSAGRWPAAEAQMEKAVVERTIRLDGKNTTYMIRVNRTGHLENLYYGKRLRQDATIEPLLPNRSVGIGTAVAYDENNPLFFMETACLETSTPGKGDFRTPAVVVEYEKGMTTLDFVYNSHRIVKGKPEVPGLLAQSYAETAQDAVTLQIQLRDRKLPILLQMNYTMFVGCDVIARTCILTNGTKENLVVRNLASLQLDLPDANWDIVSFDGAWARERGVTRRHLESGITEISSTCGVSSSFHNSAVFLERPDCTAEKGECLAFNLIYSGNHREIIEKSPFSLARFQTGINPQNFSWILAPGKEFTTPEAVMTYSCSGNNTASTNMHTFVNKHIVRGTWKYRQRPVLCNNWEATYFNFSEDRILELAESAHDLGVELFVLDDGWFGQRDNDTTSLGDWFVNTKKLPQGLTSLANGIHSLGMLFGIWVEPEMISRVSRLYDKHPDWAIMIPGRNPSVGRNQFILDLTRKEVRDYLVRAMGEVFRLAKADYVKWDMNRIFSDLYSVEGYFMGEFSHRYVLGLYDVMSRLVREFPKILFEGCASGGNRFDLGILCFMPQIWTSDNSDACCRTRIQGGTSYAYPASTMGAHVSASPNHQTLRKTDIESRFNVAAFGVLGYEMDLGALSASEKQAVKNQIAFYKKHRALLQYGRFFRISEGVDSKDKEDANRVKWVVANADYSEMLVLDFQILNQSNISQEILRIPFAKPEFNYVIETREQKVPVSQFGSLINMISPVHISQEGSVKKLIDKNVMLKNEDEYHIVSGDVLAYSGVRLSPQFSGTGFSSNTRVLGDFGSRLYHIYRVERKSKNAK